ncbi:MAG: helix-turn-helix domain-containing protein [Lachnospiraceae bacterium]|nr:helix-turn-helix domain-containing protein [Lachnospiraceae bacterium]
MSISIGKQIRILRQRKGVTQEAMAEVLGVSAQAISKWENSVTTPDIELLPKLAIYFGVKIDELFQIPREQEYERIQNIIWDFVPVREEEVTGIKAFLKDALLEDPYDAEASALLAGIYNWQAARAHKKAAACAKDGLEKNPDCRPLHVQLLEAMGGIVGDDYWDNHHEVIQYYKEFQQKNPENQFSLRTLLDNLIADHRYEEAEKLLAEARHKEDKVAYLTYEGYIRLGRGDREGALACFDRAIEKAPQDWVRWCFRGDLYCRLGRTEEAIDDYWKCYEMQEKPRIVDGLLSLAQIYEQQENYAEEARVWEIYLENLREDYHTVSGPHVEEIRRRIAGLKKKL